MPATQLNEFGYEVLSNPNTSIGMKGVYEHMNFPKYEFREYPKLVRTPQGKVRVESEAEEVRLRSDGQVMDAPQVNPFAEENKELRAKVEDLSAQVEAMLKVVREQQEGKKTPSKEVEAAPGKDVEASTTGNGDATSAPLPTKGASVTRSNAPKL